MVGERGFELEALSGAFEPAAENDMSRPRTNPKFLGLTQIWPHATRVSALGILSRAAQYIRLSRMRVMVSVLLLTSCCFSQAPTKSLIDPKAQYQQAMNALTGVSPNRNEITGVDLMTSSATLGYAPAQVAVGFFNETGFHVPRSPMQAADWYRKAAEQDNHLARWLLGRLYIDGELSASRTDGERWLRPAADAGNPFAAYLMALSLSLNGVDPNAPARWLRVAAEQGLVQAQFQLGRALMIGVGVPLNKREAYLWLSVSFEAGMTEAADSMKTLEAEFGSTETDKAKIKARELQARVQRSVKAGGCTGWPGEQDRIPTPPPLEIQRYCE